MQTMLAAPADSVAQLSDQFKLVTKDRAEKFILDIPAWYESVIEFLDFQETDEFPMMDQTDWFYDVSKSDLVIDVLHDSAYDIIAQPHMFDCPRELWTEEQQEQADDAIVDNYLQLESWLTHDIRLVLDFFRLCYGVEEFVGTKHERVRTRLMHYSIVEVW